MLNRVNQEMRYSLLQMTDWESNTPLHYTSRNNLTDVLKVIHESVTKTQWINLLRMKGLGEMTVLQTAVFLDKQCSIETIWESVSDEVWIELLSSSLPEYDRWQHNELKYQRAVSEIE